MSFLKSLWADMVEKRLWPIAVVLVIALVAVPVFLGSGGDDASPAPLGVTGASGAEGQVAQVVLDPTVPVRRNRLGKLRDPFRQHVGATGATGATGVSGTTGAGSTTTPTPTIPSVTTTPTVPSTTTPSTTPTTPQTTPTAPATKPVYAVTLRVGATGGKRTSRKVQRLTPLPSTANPFIVYLGVLADQKTAVFLLSSQVVASGDGTCKPKPSSCQTVELQKGDTEFFDLAQGDGTVTQFQLDLQGVTKVGTTTTKAVAAEHAVKKTKTATAATGDGELGTTRYSYDDDTGLLQRVGSSARMTAHLPGARSRSALPSGYVPDDQLLPMPLYSPGL